MKSTGRWGLHTRWTAGECGLTLVELLIALAIISALGSAAVIATYELLTASRQANDEQLAVSQVRAVEHYMTRDTLTSQSVTPDETDPSGFPLVLAWESFDGTNHSVTYSFQTSPNAPLMRMARVEVTDTNTSTLVVADYMDPTQCECSFDGETLTVTLVAKSHDYETERTFESKPRSEAPPT